MTANAHPKVISSQSPLAMKMVVGVAALPDPGRAATAMATTPSPNMIRVIVPRNSADNSPHRPFRPNVCRPAPCIGRYSSAMPKPPIVPSDNLVHLWETGGTPAPSHDTALMRQLLPSRTSAPPLRAVGVRPALDALVIIRYRRALSTHSSECPIDQVR